MRRPNNIFIPPSLFLIIFLLTISISHAYEGEMKIYTIEESISEALENNWNVKARKEAVEEARYVQKQARADFLPGFSTSYTYRREGKVTEFVISPGEVFTMGDKNNYQWEASVSQPLFTGFALTSAYELTKLGIDISEMELLIEKLDLAIGVKEAYINILRADKSLEVAGSAVELLESHLEVARNFYEVGMIPVNDLLKAEVELANSEQNLIRAGNSARLARASFNNMLSRPVNSPVNVEDIVDFTPENPDFEAYYSRAIVNRPEMKMIDINDLQIDQQVRLAKSNYYPQATLTYNYTKDMGSSANANPFQEASSWRVIAGVSWSFWNWGKDHYKVREAESRKMQLSSMKRNFEEGIRLELKQAFLVLEETEKRIPAAKKAVEQGEENLRVSQERYRAQVTTSTEVLDAQTQLTQARVNYYSALYDNHLAKAAMLRAVGEY